MRKQKGEMLSARGGELARDGGKRAGCHIVPFCGRQIPGAVAATGDQNTAVKQCGSGQPDSWRHQVRALGHELRGGVVDVHRIESSSTVGAARDQHASVGQKRCRMALSRGREDACGDEDIGRGVENLQTGADTRTEEAHRLATGDEHPAVLEQRCRLTGARLHHAGRGRPHVAHRIIDFCGTRRPSTRRRTAGHQHAPVVQHN